MGENAAWVLKGKQGLEGCLGGSLHAVAHADESAGAVYAQCSQLVTAAGDRQAVGRSRSCQQQRGMVRIATAIMSRRPTLRSQHRLYSETGIEGMFAGCRLVQL